MHRGCGDAGEGGVVNAGPQVASHLCSVLALLEVKVRWERGGAGLREISTCLSMLVIITTRGPTVQDNLSVLQDSLLALQVKVVGEFQDTIHNQVMEVISPTNQDTTIVQVNLQQVRQHRWRVPWGGTTTTKRCEF